MSDIFPAATVVLIRDSDNGLETLLLRRSKEVKFAGGSWVFPGGRFDDEDYQGNYDDQMAAARQAAVRETREEADLEVSPEGLLYFSHWTTPPESPKRFATWFFIAKVQCEGNVTVDGSEIVHHRWFNPQQALDALREKQIEMMPPTYVTLTELSECENVDQALEMYRGRPVPEFLPRFTMSDKGVAMLYPGDAGYEQGEQECPGPRHRLWLHEGGWQYEKSGLDDLSSGYFSGL